MIQAERIASEYNTAGFYEPDGYVAIDEGMLARAIEAFWIVFDEVGESVHATDIIIPYLSCVAYP